MPDDTNGNGVRLSIGTLRFLIELGLLLLAVSGWGWTIKSDVRVLTVQQQVDKEAQAAAIAELTKTANMLRVQNEEIRVALAEKGIVVKRAP